MSSQVGGWRVRLSMELGCPENDSISPSLCPFPLSLSPSLSLSPLPPLCSSLRWVDLRLLYPTDITRSIYEGELAWVNGHFPPSPPPTLPSSQSEGCDLRHHRVKTISTSDKVGGLCGNFENYTCTCTCTCMYNACVYTAVHVLRWIQIGYFWLSSGCQQSSV